MNLHRPISDISRCRRDAPGGGASNVDGLKHAHQGAWELGHGALDRDAKL
jgi:hypothetical protein